VVSYRPRKHFGVFLGKQNEGKKQGGLLLREIPMNNTRNGKRLVCY
jgi:hypothetical protein